MLNIIATSDLHGARPEIPECDILIVAGDTTARDSYDERMRFRDWLYYAPAKEKVVIAGNHDSMFMYDPREQVKEAHYLLNSGIDVMGLKVWGSPYTPPFMSWNFMPEDDERRDAFMTMPDKFDILVTHGPEYGILDRNTRGEWCGDKVLASVLSIKQPKVHIFGHIHEGFGHTKISGKESYNVSYVDQYYQNTNRVVKILLDKDGKVV